MAQIGREEDARTGCEGSGLGGAGLEETWSGLEEVHAICRMVVLLGLLRMIEDC